jgi:catechol 2,3-dioxygenase-like lactoylglutathione lyase family enzyme
MKFFHTGISVNNLKESRSFYEKVFGLKFKAAGKRPEVGIKFEMLEDEKGTVIELIEHANPNPLTQDLMDFSNVGLKHIAFVVDNIESVIARAETEGAKVIWEPRKGVTVKRVAFISDPNTIPLELVEL